MKTNALFCAIMFICMMNAMAQTPGVKYQTVVRDASGNLFTNQPVAFRLSILSGTPFGPVVYSERHLPTTNNFGLANLEIGTGTVLSGNFMNISWGSGYYYLQTEVDLNGGTDYEDMGTSQFQYVPFAFFAEKSRDSYWTASGADIYNSNLGNVGIGVGSPADKLDVFGSVNVANGHGYKIDGTAPQAQYLRGNGSFFTTSPILITDLPSGSVPPAGTIGSTMRHDGSAWASTTNLFNDPTTNNIGIGTLTPATKLHVNGSFRLSNGTQASGRILISDPSGTAIWTDQTNISDGDWNVNGSDMYANVMGFVGIGVTNPDQRLSVLGTIKSSVSMMTGNGNFTTPSYRFGDGTEVTGISSPTINSLGLITNGLTRFYVNSTGNVGIGTTSPATKLHLSGTLRIADGTQANGRILISDANGTASWTNQDNISDGDWTVTAPDMFSAVSGNVGIGTSTPDRKLTVSGDIRSWGNLYPSYGDYTNPSIIFGDGLENSGFSSPLSNAIALITNSNTRMLVTSSGNVGIGTNNPLAKLHVSGTLRLADGTQGSGRILISDANGTASWTSPTNITDGDWTISGTNLYSTVSGNVGIGKTNPSAKLEVAGRISQTNLGYSTFFGERAGIGDDLSNNGNVFIGHAAGELNTSGDQNISIGYYALRNNVTSNFNVAIGYRALVVNTNSHNVAVGANNLQDNTTGSLNTAIGSNTMPLNVSGYGNVAIGPNALYNNNTGSGNIAIGYMACFNGSDYAYSIALGSNAAITASYQARIGTASTTSIGGYVGWTNLSDERFKLNVKQNVPGLSFILKLQPVTYQLDVDKLNQFLKVHDIEDKDGRLQQARLEKSAQIQTGLIAQQVEQIASELGFDFSGIDKPKNENDHYGLRYAEFVVPLIKAVQEQQAIIEKLTERIELLEKSK